MAKKVESLIPETPWEFIDAMTIEKKDLDMSNPSIAKNYSPYKINRWLSSIELFIPIVDGINIHGKYMSKQSHYNFLKDALPKAKVYINYDVVKAYKDLNLNEIRYVADYFKVGIKEAKMYINMLSNKEIKDILKSYKFGMHNEMIEV